MQELTRRCASCGHYVSASARYCTACGNPMMAEGTTYASPQGYIPAYYHQTWAAPSFWRMYKASVVLGIGAVIMLIASFIPWATGMYGNSYNIFGSPLGILVFFFFVGPTIAFSIMSYIGRSKRNIYIGAAIYGGIALGVAVFLATGVVAAANESAASLYSDTLTVGPGVFFVIIGAVVFLVGAVIGMRSEDVRRLK